VAGWSSVSKYAMLGCLRACVQSISYEILMSAVLLNLVLFAGVINFELIVSQQETVSFIFFFPYLAVIGFLATLMESNKPPFDLSEAESDIVAGYTVEYAGILFGLFMLAEYLNLFTNAIVLVILFLGSWWTISHYLGNF
jgi:NADH-quinone oxidoreductase subunit H